MFPGLHSPVFEFLVLAFTLASSRIQFIDVPVSGCFKDLQKKTYSFGLILLLYY